MASAVRPDPLRQLLDLAPDADGEHQPLYANGQSGAAIVVVPQGPFGSEADFEKGS